MSGDKFTKTAVITFALTIFTCSVSNAEPLAVVSTNPANGATGVPIGTDISVTFDQEIDPNSLNTQISGWDGIEYTSNVFNIASNKITSTFFGVIIKYDSLTKTATWKSDGRLNYGETVTVSVPVYPHEYYPGSEEIRSIMGEKMAGVYTFSFKIEYDPAPPTVLSAPNLSNNNHYLNENINFEFNEIMDTSTVNSTNVIISDGTDIVEGIVTIEHYFTTEFFYFRPNENLKANTTYTMTIKKEVTDKGGQLMESDYTTSFKTGDRTYVKIISTSPAQYASQVPLDTTITFTFDRPMLTTNYDNEISLFADDVDCDPPPPGFNTYIAGVSTYDADTDSVTFTPDRDLVSGCYYTVIVDRNVYGEIDSWVYGAPENIYPMQRSFELSFYTGFSHYLNPVPTLSEWGMIIMATAMIGYALTRRETFGSIT